MRDKINRKENCDNYLKTTIELTWLDPKTQEYG